MPFDQPTRNRLARFVADARSLLSEEFTRQLQHEYGMDPASGDVADVGKLGHLDDARRETARILRATLAHYLAGAPKADKKARQETLARIVREQAYTVLNRLAALRMAEARGLLIESVGRGYQSRGFQLYAHLAGPALGETGAAYRSFLFSLFDELAVELPALFDRFSPQGRLFPREASLLRLLDLLNVPDLEALWGEDETLGWIYQYFNSSEERRQMRAESQAPRNSRELAVRNQFFTPRYVVEFLTDNTLGRIWYEMTAGRTQLAEGCRYLVRRPLEVFLPEAGFEGYLWDLKAHELIFEEGWRALPDDLDWDGIRQVALALDGYSMERQLYGKLPEFESVGDLANQRAREFHETGVWRGNSLELWLCLFFEQRRSAHWGYGPDESGLVALRALYHAWRAALAREAGETDQAALLNQPVYIRPRPLKDPREIKLLDPACGSMHFGLYAFDLFERIYEEAWELEGSGYALLVTHHAPLHTDYPTKEALSRAIPRLIIEHNIHGIDIDPRAVQIAGLSLWLRAQRSWQAQGVKPQDRPRIQRSHIVCAEPMPGEAALLEEFLAGLRADRLEGLIRRVLYVPATQQVRATARMADALCDLVRVVWDEMTLAGEAGSLLKIEETLANAVRAAEREWSERMPLFRVVEFGLTGETERVRYPRTIAGQEEGADFWAKAEALVLAALHDYAEQAQNGAGYQRRLFASDAARGFAFIDICRQRYDVVLMNPPFGLGLKHHYSGLKSWYPDAYTDVYASFLSRASVLCSGRIGAITSRSVLVTSKLQRLRQNLLLKSLCVILDLGWPVMDDATVQSAAYVIDLGNPYSENIIAIDRKQFEIKNSGLEDICFGHRDADSTFWVRRSQMEKLPQAKLLYSLPPQAIHLLITASPLGPEVLTVKLGMRTFNDFRFIRLRNEVDYRDVGPDMLWEPLAKGGPLAFFYSDLPLLVRWNRTGEEIGEVNRMVNGQTAQSRQASIYYRNPGGTYSRRCKDFGVRVLPAGFIIGEKGPAVFAAKAFSHLFVTGLLNSRLMRAFVNIQANAKQYDTGIIEQLPWQNHDDDQIRAIEYATDDAVQSLRMYSSIDECSALFITPPIGNSITAILAEHLSRLEATRSAVALSFSQIDQIIDSIYGIDSTALEDTVRSSYGDEDNSPVDPGGEDGDLDDSFGLSELEIPDATYTAAAILSYCMGNLMGRWDVRYCIDSKPFPKQPDPFGPLPICPPGMLQNAHGLPAAPADVPADYPLRISWPGILVDDPGHPEDIEARVRDALRVIWPGAEGERYTVNGERTSDDRLPFTVHRSPILGTGEPGSPATADQIEQEACQILGVPSLREYFASPGRFFDDHLKRYSKSRRAAPIYWPLSTASGSYTLWLYYHRLSDQTLYWCVNDFVEPRLAEVRDQRLELQRRSGRTAREEKELERLSEFEIELREFRDELLRVAAFWRPNLNDGVQITAAPLWRLFRHRAWQRRLKETWEQLEAGAYDWAHLALSIWPARVVPKCVTDRSLAIAHDLEDVFWVEDPPGSWRNLRLPDEEIAGLVATQQSPARERLAVLLAELARGRGRGLRCAQVWDELAAGRWDDLEASLLLWPQRVAERCWDDPLLAVTLQINLPTKRTKAARERFVKERVAAGCADLAAALEAALRERPDRFASFWSELARGDHDHLRLALALWPARVVEKCAVDVELADGHEVRRFLWVRGGGEWRRRMVVEEAVKDAVGRKDVS